MRRATGVIALVSLLTLGVFASAASADPLAMTFTEGRANAGEQLFDDVVFAPPNTASFTGQIDPSSGSITDGVLQFPEFSTEITKPFPAEVKVDFEIKSVTGSFNQATGGLTLEGEAGGTLTSGEVECAVSTEPPILTLSTTGSSGGAANPRSGAPFTAGLAEAGAIAGEWTDMEAEPINGSIGCGVVEENIEGLGGVWLERKGNPVPPPTTQPTSTNPTPACVVPKLAGKTLARAKAALTSHNCKLGTVRRPKGLKGKKRALVVKSFSPKAGASPASGEVNLRLGPKPRKGHH